MSLLAVLDAFTDRLSDGLGSGIRVGDVQPVAGSELPAVTLSIEKATSRLAGIGTAPRGTRRGALSVAISVDLADPVLDIGGGEKLSLISADRRTLTLPNGPLVRADGVADLPFTGGDLQAENGGEWNVVAGEPAAGQVRPDPILGLLHFGSALPASGTLDVHHFIGQWDVVVSRFQGELIVSLAATDPQAIRVLTRQVVDVLDRQDPGGRLAPVSWGPSSAQRLGDDDSQLRVLGYRFDAEIEEPLLPTGGGVISRVAVDVRRDDTVESFAVAREGSPA